MTITMVMMGINGHDDGGISLHLTMIRMMMKRLTNKHMSLPDKTGDV